MVWIEHPAFAMASRKAHGNVNILMVSFFLCINS